ncbi:hypothetical protein GCM10027566_39250 [Arachidicoccus ginsenosidivorans]|uniref:T9SS type A sorting domain-containing protein n=1 Tax=Arachidicoccus ginsenosidivorans TaxID=496057 RepID=A0A5B8VMF4_9BACT|nr:Ig-like domain-containing protein [Arachidicoccus ginsenosidivorans]QEC72271.1 T9SS type A sorting domain-containing protein [Arachidicoccus ginsenosidivorans]
MKREFYTCHEQASGDVKSRGFVSTKTFIKSASFLMAFALLGTVAFAQTPSAANDAATTGKNMPVTIKVLANDAGYVANKTTIEANPSHGTAEINPNTGIINYWPAADYTGNDQLTYRISNKRGNTATAQVSITINDEVCSTPINGNDFSWTDQTSSETVITKAMTQPATSNGFVFDIYKLDNSFNMKINGIDLASQEIQFQSDGTSGVNIQYQDGEDFENGRSIWELEGDEAHPTVRVQILPDGSIKMFVVKSSGGELYPVELMAGAQFNAIPWHPDAENKITVTQEVSGPTVMEGKGYGLNAIDNPVISLNTEGGQAATEAPTTCGGNGIIHLNITGVDDGVYDLAYQGGTLQNVQITAGKADVSAAAGVYNNITIGNGNCQSADGVNAEIYAFPCTVDDVANVERGTVTGNVLDNDGNDNAAGFVVTEVTIGGQQYPVDATNGSDIELPGKGNLHVNPDGSFTFEPDGSFSGPLDEITYTVDNGHGTTNTGKLQISINSTLPVSGVQDFNVVRKGQTAILSWSTFTESQNKGFRAERSTDGKSWKAIGFKNSLGNAGNSTSQLNYTLVDADPLQQTAYYRLVQVDLSGRENVLSVVKSLNGILNSLRVYPNPAGDHITIMNPASIIYIYDVSGRNVMTQGVQPGVKSVNLNVQGLAQGIYFVKSGSQRIKLIKK